MRGRYFTETEDRLILAQRRAGAEFIEIAGLLGRNNDSVRSRFYYLISTTEASRPQPTRSVGAPLYVPLDWQEDDPHVEAINALGGFTRENQWTGNVRPATGDTRGVAKAIKAMGEKP